MFLIVLSFTSVIASHYEGEYISKFAYNSSGSESAVINCAVYSSDRCDFIIQPPADEVWEIHRLIFSIGDNGVISSEDYGGISNGLTNGIEIRSYTNGVEFNLTNDQPVLENAHWGKFMYDISIVDWGSGFDYVQGRWTFANSGTVILLNGSMNDSIRVIIQDDLSSLHEHNFLFQGHVLNQNATQRVTIAQNEADIPMALLSIVFLLAIAAAVSTYAGFGVRLENVPKGRVLEKAFLYILSVVSIPISVGFAYMITLNNPDVTYLSSVLLTFFILSIFLMVIVGWSHVLYLVESIFGSNKDRDEAEDDN